MEPPVKQKLKSNKSEDGIMKEIKQLTNARYDSELRKELFDGDDTSVLRRRGANDSSENMEKYYANIQERLADEMLSLTRNLKEQTLTANKILKKDTEVILEYLPNRYEKIMEKFTILLSDCHKVNKARPSKYRLIR